MFIHHTSISYIHNSQYVNNKKYNYQGSHLSNAFRINDRGNRMDNVCATDIWKKIPITE